MLDRSFGPGVTALTAPSFAIPHNYFGFIGCCPIGTAIRQVSENQDQTLSIIEPVTPNKPAPTTATVRQHGLSDSAIMRLQMRVARRVRNLQQVRPISLGSRADIADSRVADLFEICVKVLAQRLTNPTMRAGHSLDEPTGSDGKIHADLELLLFGLWLLIDGKPGMATAPGKQVDELMVFKTITAAASIMVRRSATAKLSQPEQHKKHLWLRQGRITTLEMRIISQVLFDENLKETVFKSRMVTAARFLDAYLAQLGEQRIAGTAAKSAGYKMRSPELKLVLAALRPVKRR